MSNKAARAKLGKETINKVIPKILNSNARARDAVGKSELIHFSAELDDELRWKSPENIPRFVGTRQRRDGRTGILEKGEREREIELSKSGEEKDDRNEDSSSKRKRKLAADTSALMERSIRELSPTSPPAPTIPQPEIKISIIQSDTFDAAHTLVSANPHSRVAVLNMASALRPGGGVLNGARAQEESLCLRSTLYHHLPSHFYRIPDTAAIYSPDVLVFRNSQNEELEKAEWWHVDVVSCAALRGPDVVLGGEDWVARYERESDRETMMLRVRLLFQVARARGVRRLVLGAWGCGAYGNPPWEVARIFRKVILGDRKRRGVASCGIEEIVFAIYDRGENLRVFEEVLGGLSRGLSEGGSK